jgi:hypothetical protein
MKGVASGLSAHLAASILSGSRLSQKTHLNSVLPFKPAARTVLFPQRKHRDTRSIASSLWHRTNPDRELWFHQSSSDALGPV